MRFITESEQPRRVYNENPKPEMAHKLSLLRTCTLFLSLSLCAWYPG